MSLQADKVALLAIKASIKADPQGLLSDWRDDVDHCGWRGVGCDASGRVIFLNITGGGLRLKDTPTSSCGSYKVMRKTAAGSELSCLAYEKTAYQAGCPNEASNSTTSTTCLGTLSPAVGKLTELRVLSLPFNGFSGRIPQTVSSLKLLEYFDLQGNVLSGSLPSGLGHLSNLRTLNVAHNELQGIIPQEISSCRNLEVLNMAGNRLSGAIPTYFGHMPNLRVVALSSNQLFSTIPSDLTSNCGRLEHVHLENNYLYGEIPKGFGSCSHLQSLLLSSNALSGTIPADIGQLQELQVLDVSSNSLGDSIPEELANCSQLSVLVLTDSLSPCQKIPSIPISKEEAGSYQKGEYNYFSSIPANIMALPNLRLLWAPGAAALGGTLSSRWGSSLEVLNLASNSLTGSIPEQLAQCQRLLYLDLSSNKLEGSLPSFSVQCMVVFNVSGNGLTGELPGKFSTKCPRSILLDSLSTDIPKPLLLGYGSFAMGALFSYSSSLYCGAVLSRLPSWFSDQSIAVVHDMSRNNFTGALQSAMIGDALLTRAPAYGLSVSGNQLSGSLSSSLFMSCQRLGGLSLKVSRNRLSGVLPADAISNCTSLRQFEAAGNQLNGTIPQSHGKWKHLVEIDLSSNGLAGELRTNVSGEGNALATPAPSNQGYEEEPYAGQVVTKTNSHPNAIMIAAITAGCAIAAVLIILLLLFHFSRQDNRVFYRQERRHLTMFRNFEAEFTYEDVVAATGNFSLNNLIGTGGFGATYKAELSPGLLVAVKRLSAGRFQGTQQFEAEIRTLGRVQHPNLVTLLGYHASDNEKFLVYNFLPGGNLENLIHDPRGGSVSWRVRFRIALNIAQALAYLHDECTPKVLHRDIKPSNVLLDNNLNAFLSDFGLARLLNASETHATTDVAGTFGYVAPEYAMTCRLSEKADVYSYGVVLLELLSGKKALDPFFSKYGNGFNIVHWASHFYTKGRYAEILAPGLWEQGPHSELLEGIKLAVRCTMVSLSIRPTMRQVVNILKAMG